MSSSPFDLVMIALKSQLDDVQREVQGHSKILNVILQVTSSHRSGLEVQPT